MIRSQRELKRKQQCLAALERAIAGFEVAREDAEAVGLRCDALKADIEAYRRLRVEGLAALRIARLADVPAGLIQGRIACGLSQAALATRLGVAPQQVQHWESELYAHASFAAVLEVATALGIAGSIQLVGEAERPAPCAPGGSADWPRSG